MCVGRPGTHYPRNSPTCCDVDAKVSAESGLDSFPVACQAHTRNAESP